MAKGKYQSFWPLPGGNEKYVETLLEISNFVSKEKPKVESLKAHLLTFPKVTKSINVRSYINTALLHSGLFSKDGDYIKLTLDGKKFLEERDIKFLYKILVKNVVGFDETLKIIARNPCNLETLREELMKELEDNDLSWTAAYGQPYWRACWLRSMSLINFNGHIYTISETGRNLLPREDLTIKLQNESTKIERKHTDSEVDLREYEEICRELKKLEHDSKNPDLFEIAITKAFKLLGFKTVHLGNSGETDVLATASLGRKAYTIMIDAKTTSNPKVSERQISWPSLQEHHDKHNADFIVVVGPDFAGGDLIDRSLKYNVLLMQTAALIRILRMHEKYFFNLEELREIFGKVGLFDIEDSSVTLEAQSVHEQQMKLFTQLLSKIWELQKEKENTKVNDLRWALNREFEDDEINDTLKFLEYFSAIERNEDGNCIAVMTPNVLSRKMMLYSMAQRTNNDV